MKKAIFCFIVGFFLFMLLPACQKGKMSAQHQIINVTLKNSDIYQYDLGGFGDEEGASITQQALHYDTSTIDRGVSISTIYKYKSVPGYVGTDEVEIKSARGSNGASANNKIILTNIKFTITN